MAQSRRNRESEVHLILIHLPAELSPGGVTVLHEDAAPVIHVLRPHLAWLLPVDLQFQGQRPVSVIPDRDVEGKLEVRIPVLALRTNPSHSFRMPLHLLCLPWIGALIATDYLPPHPPTLLSRWQSRAIRSGRHSSPLPALRGAHPSSKGSRG
jgi:hypothetical protein